MVGWTGSMKKKGDDRSRFKVSTDMGWPTFSGRCRSDFTICRDLAVYDTYGRVVCMYILSMKQSVD